MINEALAREKELIKENDNLYKELEKKYKYLLEYYLSTVIDLKKYDKEINESNLNIGKNTRYKSLNEYLDLDYIFLINRLFIEKLSNDDIKTLKNSDKNNISDELINLVKRTYKDVIYDNYLKNDYTDKVYKVCYGAFVPFNFVDNNSLVFKIYYGKNTKDVDDNEVLELYKNQMNFLEKIKKKLVNEIERKLTIKCEILIEKDIN